MEHYRAANQPPRRPVWRRRRFAQKRQRRIVRKPQEPTAEPHASPGGSAPLPVAPGPLSPEAAAAPGAAEEGAPEPGGYAIEEIE